MTQEAANVSVTTAWAAIRRVQQAGGFLLFRTSRDAAQYLPLRALGAEAEEARRIIRRNAGDRARL